MVDKISKSDGAIEDSKDVDGFPITTAPSKENVAIQQPNNSAKEDLITTAVSFLQNSNVSMRPREEIINFLKRKGLSEFEIYTALRRVENTMNKTIMPMAPTPYNGYAHPLVPQRAPTSPWSTAKSTMNTLVLISGAAYGCHLLYQWILKTYFKSGSVDQLTVIMEMQKNMKTVMERVSVTLDRMQTQSVKQTKLIEEFLISQKRSNVVDKDELMNELTCIKSLLLNKRAFPAAPATGTLLPQWQQLKSQSKQDTENHAAATTNGIEPDSDQTVNTTTEEYDDLTSTLVDGSSSEEGNMKYSMKISTDESLMNATDSSA